MHFLDLYDENFDHVVIGKHTDRLRFRVKNPPKINGEDTEEVPMDTPIVSLVNKGEYNVVYPVVKGHGAKPMTLKPGRYEDFTLEFNCIANQESTAEV